MTHESNKEYYLDILFDPRPWTLQPDRMSVYQPDVHDQPAARADRTVGDRYAISHRRPRVLEILSRAGYGVRA